MSNLLLRDRIQVVLVQILNRTLFEQPMDGEWASHDSHEDTAYGVLILKTLSCLPWHALLHEIIMSSIRVGQRVLGQSEAAWSRPSHLWIGKVPYGLATLSEAYCLAAMNAPQHVPHVWSSKVASFLEIPEKAVLETVSLAATLKDYQHQPIWRLQASAIEGCMFLPKLRSVQSDIFPQQEGAKNAYMAFIPFTWVLVNNIGYLNVPADLLLDMMIVSACNYRMDEYMDTTVAGFSEADIKEAKRIICDLCSEQSEKLQPKDQPLECSFNPTGDEESALGVSRLETQETPARVKRLSNNEVDFVDLEADQGSSTLPVSAFRDVIGRYTRAMLTYPRLLHASSTDRANLRRSLHTYLLAHIAQVADSSRFSFQASRCSSNKIIFSKPRSSFYTWAHTTGADTLSSPFAFDFLVCLVGAASSLSQSKGQSSSNPDCFGLVGQKYLAEDLSSRLAVMGRLYNDYGSVTRDRLEHNVNSINFPEFHPQTGTSDISVDEILDPTSEKKLKENLLRLADYERHGADEALARLLVQLNEEWDNHGAERRKQNANAVELFSGVAKLYADIYVARDISNCIKKEG
ncbi:MAG: hypothetical protein Q9201_000054 [Fulgogasparrea decipioides]